MRLLTKPVLISLCAFVPLVFGSLAIAKDVPGQQIPADPFPLGSSEQIRMGGTGAIYLTTADNENNAGTGVPDNDMGGFGGSCLYNNSPIHPIEFNIDVTGALPSSSVELMLRGWDIDPPEFNEVFVNGTYVGLMTGSNNQWSTTVLDVPIALIVPGNNLIRVDVDRDNVGSWCTWIASGQLVIDGGAPSTAWCRSLSLDQSNYQAGDTVNASVEADTSLVSQDVSVELNLLGPAANIVVGSLQSALITGTDDDAFDFSLALPGSADDGIYSAQALIYDTVSGQLQDTCNIDFNVGNVGGPPPTPALPVPMMGGVKLAILALLLLLVGLAVRYRQQQS